MSLVDARHSYWTSLFVLSDERLIREASKQLLSQVDAEIMCLAMFLIGRLSRIHKSVTAQLKLLQRQAELNVQHENYKNEDDSIVSSRLGFLSGLISQKSSSSDNMSNSLMFLHQLATEILDTPSISFTSLVLLDSCLDLLQMKVVSTTLVFISNYFTFCFR